MRTIKKFDLDNPIAFKRKMLSWGEQFEELVWLDSNDYPQKETNFEAVLAVQAFTLIKTDHHNAFENLKEYQEHTADWIFGYLSYDLKNDVEDLISRNFDGLHFPDLYFFQPAKIIQITGGKAVFHYLKMVDDEMETDLEEILKEGCVEQQKQGQADFGDLEANSINNPEVQEEKNNISGLSQETIREKPANKTEITARISREQYLRKIENLLSYIHRGDIYEANFCQEFYAENKEIEPLQVFQRLNEISHSPFAVYLKMGNHYLLSASPERYLKKEGNKISSQPIKGTAPRAKDPIEDAKIAESLSKDPKERSENIMIVDLVRNDLSRVAKKGSVRVEELCKVYSFQQVHQMISTVSAELDEGIPAVEVLRATFPMGSMTGAPKISAMKIIEELEETKRGLYSGAVGYFTPQGEFDFNVVIRSILYNAAKKYVSFSVGGAITSRSIAEREYEECLLKARAMRQVLSRKL